MIAAYTAGLVALLGGGGDEPAPVGAERQLTALERKVAAIVGGTDPVEAREQGDVERFRRPTVRTVACPAACEVVYSVGLPGRGRILEDQREMWATLFTETDVQRATLRVTRDIAAAGATPKAGGEETPSGAPLLNTTCDRSKSKNVDWGSARGEQILASICEVEAFNQGRRANQAPVAPDDPLAGRTELPQMGQGGGE